MGGRKERRKETDKGRASGMWIGSYKVFFTLVLLTDTMDPKARRQCYSNKCQDQISRNKYKTTLKQAICQTVFRVQGSIKKSGRK